MWSRFRLKFRLELFKKFRYLFTFYMYITVISITEFIIFINIHIHQYYLIMYQFSELQKRYATSWLTYVFANRHGDLSANANWYFVLGRHGRSRGGSERNRSKVLSRDQETAKRFCGILYNIYASNAIESNCRVTVPSEPSECMKSPLPTIVETKTRFKWPTMRAQSYPF